VGDERGASAAGVPVDRHLWEETLRERLRGPVKARYAPASYLGTTGSTVRLGLPNEAHRDKCEQHRELVERELSSAAGAVVAVELVTDGGSGGGWGGDADDAPPGDREGVGRPGDEEDIDPHDLVDVPPESVKSPIDRLAEAFPGSELVEDRG
jgi:DNA polymerase-3 subunit gamma/tau